MIPFPRQPQYEDVSEGQVNPNLYVTLSATTSSRIWSADVYPWIEGVTDPFNIVVDSYSETNRNTDSDLFLSGIGNGQGVGQSFTASETAYLTSLDFYLKKTGSPVGNATAALYSHSGTYGTSSVPLTLLATSTAKVVTGLTASSVINRFTFDGTYQMVKSTKYVCAILYADVASNNANAVKVGIDSTSPTHDGNMSRLVGGVWAATASQDVCFYVNGHISSFAHNAPDYSSPWLIP